MSQAVPSSPRQFATPPWLRWQIVGLLVAYSFMTWFNRVSMSVAYDEQIKEQSGISPEKMGTVYSAFLFAYMVCMTPGGWLIDRFGPWAALAVMGLGSALFGALTGMAGLVAAGLLFPALFCVRSLMGMLTAPVYPGCTRVVANWLPVSQCALANGLIQAAAAIGITCTFPVFGALIDVMGWQSAFFVSGAVTMVVALAWMAYGANYPWQHRSSGSPRDLDYKEPRAHAELDGTAWWMLLKDRSLVLLTLSYAAVNYVEYLFFFWMHYYFEDVLHFEKNASRNSAALLTLAMAVGMMLGGWVVDVLRTMTGRNKVTALVPALGLCAGSVLLVLGLLAQDTVWIVTLLALALASIGATESPVWTMSAELGRGHGGTAAAICNTGGNLGGLLAPMVTPIVGGMITHQFGVPEQVGWQWSIGVGSLVAILGAALWFWITPPEEPIKKPEESP